MPRSPQLLSRASREPALRETRRHVREAFHLPRDVVNALDTRMLHALVAQGERPGVAAGALERLVERGLYGDTGSTHPRWSLDSVPASARALMSAEDRKERRARMHYHLEFISRTLGTPVPVLREMSPVLFDRAEARALQHHIDRLASRTHHHHHHSGHKSAPSSPLSILKPKSKVRWSDPSHAQPSPANMASMGDLRLPESRHGDSRHSYDSTGNNPTRCQIPHCNECQRSRDHRRYGSELHGAAPISSYPRERTHPSSSYQSPVPQPLASPYVSPPNNGLQSYHQPPVHPMAQQPPQYPTPYNGSTYVPSPHMSPAMNTMPSPYVPPMPQQQTYAGGSAYRQSPQMSPATQPVDMGTFGQYGYQATQAVPTSYGAPVQSQPHQVPVYGQPQQTLPAQHTIPAQYASSIHTGSAPYVQSPSLSPAQPPMPSPYVPPMQHQPTHPGNTYGHPSPVQRAAQPQHVPPMSHAPGAPGTGYAYGPPATPPNQMAAAPQTPEQTAYAAGVAAGAAAHSQPRHVSPQDLFGPSPYVANPHMSAVPGAIGQDSRTAVHVQHRQPQPHQQPQSHQQPHQQPQSHQQPQPGNPGSASETGEVHHHHYHQSH